LMVEVRADLELFKHFFAQIIFSTNLCLRDEENSIFRRYP
jgi:hypothetical protein